MSLRQQQDVLARLYTDNEFRSEFLRKPSLFAERLGVSKAKADELAAVAGDEVAWFSESLLSKRLREVRKMLPMSEEEIGSDAFTLRFRDFADTFSPLSVKKHLEDALAFAGSLERDLSIDPIKRSVVRFESRRLRQNALRRLFSFCLLRSDPRRGTGHTTCEKRHGVGVWIAIGGWSRIFFRTSRRRGPS